MEKPIDFIVPIRLISELNNFDHWAKKRKRKKENCFFISSFFNVSTQGRNITLPCKIILTRLAPKVLDYDNLVAAFKGIRDCIADKIIPGLAPGRADGDPRLNWEYQQKETYNREYAVQVQIYPFNSHFPS